MSYSETGYKGWIIREHFADAASSFEILIAGQSAGFFSTLRQARHWIDYQIAYSAPGPEMYA